MYKGDSLQEEQLERNQKTLLVIVFMAVSFIVLLLRLIYLQIYMYQENFRLSENNRMRRVIIRPERGVIYDRNSEILVRNRPSYHISVIGNEVRERDSVFANLLKIEGSDTLPVFDSAYVYESFQRMRFRRFQPIRLLEDASIEEVSIIAERQQELPGIHTLVESRRDYPYGTLAAHLLGYTGEVSEEEKRLEMYAGYLAGERVGKKGLERQYERFFRGKSGVKFIEVDAYGRQLGLLENMPHELPEPGLDIITTIDLELQKVAEAAMPDSILGALVALDPRTGEVLAMVSSPRIDPNIFSLERQKRSARWAEVALDSDRPLNNRATVGLYDPGSVFKFITAAAGLEEKAITPSSRSYKGCTGGFHFGRRYQRCWLDRGHGVMDITGALRESCNVYFFQLGLQIGIGPINEMAEKYGLGRKTGIDLPEERDGLLMDSLVYTQRFRHLGWIWTRGQILNLAIGQGQLITPLQTAMFFGAMARNENVYQPHLMKYIIDRDKNIIKRNTPKVIGYTGLSPETQRTLLHAMEEVVVGYRGTGGRSRVKGVRVGGKTGSAQNPHGERTHAWYVAAAPLENPVIAIAVVLENAGHGGAVAAPVVGKVLNYYFLGNK
jgi:penicillin-binding protein 2